MSRKWIAIVRGCTIGRSAKPHARKLLVACFGVAMSAPALAGEWTRQDYVYYGAEAANRAVGFAVGRVVPFGGYAWSAGNQIGRYMATHSAPAFSPPRPVTLPRFNTPPFVQRYVPAYRGW